MDARPQPVQRRYRRLPFRAVKSDVPAGGRQVGAQRRRLHRGDLLQPADDLASGHGRALGRAGRRPRQCRPQRQRAIGGGRCPLPGWLPKLRRAVGASDGAARVAGWKASSCSRSRSRRRRCIGARARGRTILIHSRSTALRRLHHARDGGPRRGSMRMPLGRGTSVPPGSAGSTWAAGCSPRRPTRRPPARAVPGGAAPDTARPPPPTGCRSRSAGRSAMRTQNLGSAGRGGR
jgi:hypothetical protein